MGSNANVTLTNNHSYNRTKLVSIDKTTYPTGGAGNDVIGADVSIQNMRIIVCISHNAACLVISIDFPCDIAVFDDSTFRIAE